MCILLSESYVPVLLGRLRRGVKGVFLAATICSLPLAADAADPGDDYQTLTPEQAQLTDQMLAFVNKMEAKFFNVVERFNGNADAIMSLLRYPLDFNIAQWVSDYALIILVCVVVSPHRHAGERNHNEGSHGG